MDCISYTHLEVLSNYTYNLSLHAFQLARRRSSLAEMWEEAVAQRYVSWHYQRHVTVIVTTHTGCRRVKQRGNPVEVIL